MTRKVSVIIPTYNRPQFLKRAVASVLSQTYTNFDMWVIQNGSYRESEETVREFRAKGFSINYHFVKQPNPSNARNIGIRLSKGEYVAFLDDDDEWLPEKLEKQVNLLDQNPELGFVTCRAWLVDPSNQIVGQTPEQSHEDSLFELVKEGNFIRSMSFTMVRRKCLEKVGLLNSRFPIAGDYDLYIRLATHFAFQTISDQLVRYQLHLMNLSKQGYFAYREVLEILKRLRPVPNLGVTSSELSKRILKFVRLFYQEGCNELDRKDYTNAARYFRWSIYGDPFIGNRINWSRFSNPVYRLIRPYLAFVFASIRSLFAIKKKKSRIGYFLIGQAIGGNGAYVKKLIDGLNRKEWEVILYLYCPQSKERAIFVEELEKKDVRIIPIAVNGEVTEQIPVSVLRSIHQANENHQVKSSSFSEAFKSLVYNFNLVSRIRGQLVKERLDVVHFSMGIFPELLPAVVASFLAGIPRRIAFVHIIGIPPYRYKSVIPRLLLRMAVKAITVVMTYGVSMKKILIDVYGFNPNKVQIAYNGVPPQVVKADRKDNAVIYGNYASANKTVLVPARLSEEKGHRFLFEAINRLESQGIRGTYLLAGDGAIKEELEEIVSRLKLNHSVKFLGFRTDLQELMQVVDLIVLPSLNEGFPFALLEAMMAGKPFIATRVGCVEEMVEQNVNGKLIAPADVEELAKALKELLELDFYQLKEMGRRGKEKVTKEFTLEQMYQKTFRHYSLHEASKCAA